MKIRPTGDDVLVAVRTSSRVWLETGSRVAGSKDPGLHTARKAPASASMGMRRAFILEVQVVRPDCGIGMPG
jgi:hypothetical protein